MLQDETPQYNHESDPTWLYEQAAAAPSRLSQNGYYTENDKLAVTRIAWMKHLDADGSAPQHDVDDPLHVLRLCWPIPRCRAWIQDRQADLYWSKERRATFEAQMAPDLHWRQQGEDGGEALYVSQDPSDVTARAVTWLSWPGVLALGEVTALVGLPNSGKSTLTRLVAATVAQGATLPNLLRHDDDPELHKGAVPVLWVSAEEGVATTLKPGMDAAGMPPGGWRYVDARRAGPNSGPLYLDTEGLRRLRHTAERDGARLIVLDGSDGFIPPGLSANKGEDVRQIMTALTDWADGAGLSVMLFRHEGKTMRTSAVEAGTGSIQWAAAVRLAFLLAREKRGDPESPVYLAPIKDNLAPVRSIRVSIEPRLVEVQGARGVVTKPFGRAVLGTQCDDVTGDDLARQVDERRQQGDTVSTAKDFLKDLLSDGPQPVRDILAAGRDADLGKNNLHKAASELGVKKRRDPVSGQPKTKWPYVWELPEMLPNAGTIGNHWEPTETRINTNGKMVPNGSQQLGSNGEMLVPETQPDTAPREDKTPLIDPCYHPKKRQIAAGVREVWECPDCGKIRGGGHSRWRQPPTKNWRALPGGRHMEVALWTMFESAMRDEAIEPGSPEFIARRDQFQRDVLDKTIALPNVRLRPVPASGDAAIG